MLVYSYVGYNGVLRKIDYIEERLKRRFGRIQTIVSQYPEIDERFKRLVAHFEEYSEGFREAVVERNELKNMRETSLLPLNEKSEQLLAELLVHYSKAKQFKAAYSISKLQHLLLQVEANTKAFEATPDATIIKNTRAIIRQMKQILQQLMAQDSAKKWKGMLKELHECMSNYQEKFMIVINKSRVYMHLVNVVLAGRAAEIDKLSQEIDKISADKSISLQASIRRDIGDSKHANLALSVIAGLLGLVSAHVISVGIATPVSAMARTLSQLARGRSDVSIPGRERKDEVGQMAIAADEFRKMAEQLEQQTTELEEFAYRTSHDLRSPLVSSIGLLKVAKKSIESQNTEKANKSLSMAQQSLEKLELLVKDILALAKTKNVDEDIQKIEIKGVVSEAIEKLSHMENYERLSIHMSYAPDSAIVTRKSRLILVIENLLSNAIKYQDLQKESSFISVVTHKNNDVITIEIEDNGLGIPKEQQDKLFTMFKRFHPRVAFGSGLGLYMLKKSVEILQGEIAFSDTGSGSKFSVMLPITIASNEE